MLNTVVVVFAVGAGAGEADVGVVGSEEGEEVVVEEFAAMAFRLWLRSVAVDVDGFGREGKAVEEVREGVGGGLGAAVPAGGEGAPLGGRVGDTWRIQKKLSRMSPPQSATVSTWRMPGSPVFSRAPGPAGIWAASEALLPERLLGARRMRWGAGRGTSWRRPCA